MRVTWLIRIEICVLRYTLSGNWLDETLCLGEENCLYSSGLRAKQERKRYVYKFNLLNLFCFFSSYSPARSFSCPDSTQGANGCDVPFTKQWNGPSSYTKYEGYIFTSALNIIHTIQIQSSICRSFNFWHPPLSWYQLEQHRLSVSYELSQ